MIDKYEGGSRGKAEVYFLIERPLIRKRHGVQPRWKSQTVLVGSTSSHIARNRGATAGSVAFADYVERGDEV